MDEAPELRLLFHRLNNQLGIILAHAELLEAKATDDMSRARAAQVVSSALEAMGTAKEIRPPGWHSRPTRIVSHQNRNFSRQTFDAVVAVFVII